MITKDRYHTLKAIITQFDAWLASTGKNSYSPSEVPTGLIQPTNEQRSQVEVYEFCANPPDTYFCYVRRQLASVGLLNRDVEVTTWTGQLLGKGKLGRMYKCGKPPYQSLRYPIRFTGINGQVYKGTFYHSSGDYCRVRRIT